MMHTFRLAAFIACFILMGTALMAQPSTVGPEISREASPGNLVWDFFDPQPLLLLDSIRTALDKPESPSDNLLYENFSKQLDAIQLNLKDGPQMARYLQKAEVYLHGRFYLPAERAILFDAMGDKMLGKLCDTLEVSINNKMVDPENVDIAYLIQRLADDQHVLKFEVNNRAKLWRYLREGRFDYVFHKLTTTYKSEFYQLLGVLFLGLCGLIYFRKRIRGLFKRKRTAS